MHISMLAYQTICVSSKNKLAYQKVKQDDTIDSRCVARQVNQITHCSKPFMCEILQTATVEPLYASDAKAQIDMQGKRHPSIA